MFKLSKSKLPQQEQGFTLVEVLVSILITTTFVATAMQAMVLAAVFKSRAKQYSEATTWIQEDLENVRHTASQLQNTTLREPVAPGATPGATPLNATVLKVTSIVGFKPIDPVIVGPDFIRRTIAAGGVDTDNREITVTPALTTGLLPGDGVTATNKCNATSVPDGFGDYLRNNLPLTINQISANHGKKSITGQDYILLRDGPDNDGTIGPNVNNTAPFEVMQVKYEVRPQGEGDSIATMYTEVIPDAAFKCQPQQ